MRPSKTSLSGCIIDSLKHGEMAVELPSALLSADHSKLLHRDETDYWDYKVELNLDDPVAVARLAKDVLGFHNHRGGMLAIGVANNHRIPGIPSAHVKDTNVLRAKLHKYIGANVHIFQDSIPMPNGRVLWLLFIPPRASAPQAALANGPERDGKPEVRRNEYYLRRGDQVITCLQPADLEELFRGGSTSNLHPYFYEIDEPYFRLLAPDFAEFVGRTEILERIYAGLRSRHPVIALDGMGGVGKTATAIHVVRQLYDEGEQFFIVSMSAKSRVWEGSVGSRRPAFSGLTEFLRETARVLQISPLLPPAELKEAIIGSIGGYPGIFLVDNLEDITDPELLRFLSFEVPDPVKVLVTSRIDRGLGALTVSIPEMGRDEARHLLTAELSRAHYPWVAESGLVDELLKVTGCVPLALKWAASLAVSSGSLRTALERLRRDDLTRKEFLSFCFYTMFEALSVGARDIALLSAYLDTQWSLETLALGLSIPRRDVEAGLTELQQRGVVLASGNGDTSPAFRVLPLTMDFLMAKWHENERLQKRVAANLAKAVDSKDYEGIFMHWPVEQRVAALRDRAESLRRVSDFDSAIDIVGLAMRWAPADLGLRFLAGRISFESGKRTEGLALMGQAVGPASRADEHEYLAQALLSHQTGPNQPFALKELETVLLHSATPSRELVTQYCDLAFKLHDYESLSRVLERLKEPHISYWLATCLPRVFDDATMLTWCGPSLVRVLHSAATSGVAGRDESAMFVQSARRVEASMAKLGLR